MKLVRFRIAGLIPRRLTWDRRLWQGSLYLVSFLLLSSWSSPTAASTGPLTILSDTVLTEDHQGSVFVAGNNLVLDCAGHTVRPSTSTAVGILVEGRSGVTIRNCDVRGFSNGIFLRFASACSLLDNTAATNIVGLHLEFSSGRNVLNGNEATENVVGFDLFESSQNELTHNSALRNAREGFLLNGFAPSGTTGNRYENNTARSNGWGFGVLTATGNLFFHNNIIQNASQVFSPNPASNSWHHPSLLEGNFWSNYPGADDGSGLGKHTIAGDGIGDTFVPWPGLGFDAYPFVREDGWLSLAVHIDIKPGSDDNPVNISAPTVIPVAILGAGSFDVRRIDPTTLAFGPALAPPIHDLLDPAALEDHLQDVNGDGFVDLVTHYRAMDTGIGSDDVEGCIHGRTYDAIAFEGCDKVTIVPRR